MDKVSASQPQDHGLKPVTGHDHDSSVPHMTPVLVSSKKRTRE